MKRKSKIFLSLVSLCFSLAVLCFGVYSALSVTYTLSGSVSYELSDVFVDLDLSVYRTRSSAPINSSAHRQKVETIQSAGDTIPSGEDGFSQLTQYTDHESTYHDGVVEPGVDGIYTAESPNLDLTYGSPDTANQGYAFYIVIDIHNLGSEIINAQIQAPTSLENTILSDSGNIEITAQGTERIVLGLALDDATLSINNIPFTYTITITRGELPTSALYAPALNSSKDIFVKSKDDSNIYVDIGQEEYVDSFIETTQIEQAGFTLNITVSKMELQTIDSVGISFKLTPDKPLIGIFIFNDCHNDEIDALIQKSLAYLEGQYDTNILFSYIDPFLISQSEKLSPLVSIDSSIPTPNDGKFTIVIASADEISSISYTDAQTKNNERLVTYENIDKIASVELQPFCKSYPGENGFYYNVGLLNLKLTNIPHGYCLYNFEVTNLNEIASGTGDGIIPFSFLIFPGNYYSEQELLSSFSNGGEDMTFQDLLAILSAKLLMVNDFADESTVELKYKQNNELEFCCLFFGISMKGISIDLSKIECNVSYSKDPNDIFYYNLKEDNSYEVSGLKVYDFVKDANSDKYEAFSEYQGILAIPNKYQGVDVTSVSDSAFSCIDVIIPHPSRIIISENIKDLGAYSFYCELSEVYIQSQDVVNMIVNDELLTAGGILSGNGNLYIRTDLTVTEYIESLEKLPDIVEFDSVEYFCYVKK